jgi:hypothetical protein
LSLFVPYGCRFAMCIQNLVEKKDFDLDYCLQIFIKLIKQLLNPCPSLLIFSKTLGSLFNSKWFVNFEYLNFFSSLLSTYYILVIVDTIINLKSWIWYQIKALSFVFNMGPYLSSNPQTWFYNEWFSKLMLTLYILNSFCRQWCLLVLHSCLGKFLLLG